MSLMLRSVDRLHDSRFEIPAEAHRRCLNHRDGDEILPGVDPETGAERAVPPITSIGEPRVPRAEVGDDANAETPSLTGLSAGQRVGHMYGGHQLDGARCQQTPAIQLSAAEQHLREAHVVLRTRLHFPPDAAIGWSSAYH